ncbi:MAG: response regulator [Bacteroidetes bacterium]|nr:response regulator [Bacteroidota bacterium]
MSSYNDPDIVLVEDNLNDAELAIRALSKGNPGKSILHLLDGEEALNYFFPKTNDTEQVRDKLPRIILLDLKLPKVDGFEVLQALKKNNITKLIPVIILSSSAEQKDVLYCYSHSVNSYIVKPVDFDSFSDTIASVGKYWLSFNQPIQDEPIV